MIDALTFTALLVPLASFHADRSAPCEINPGIAAEFRVGDNEDLSLIAGGYRNSHCRTTVMAQVAYMPLTIGPVKLGASLGVGTGYDQAIVGGFQARFWDHLNLTFIPPTGTNSGVIGASIRVPF